MTDTDDKSATDWELPTLSDPAGILEDGCCLAYKANLLALAGVRLDRCAATGCTAQYSVTVKDVGSAVILTWVSVCIYVHQLGLAVHSIIKNT